MVAEIRAAGYGAMQDINQNLQSDYMDVLDRIQKTEQYDAQMNIQSNAQTLKAQQHNDKMSIEQQRLSIARQQMQTDLEIARTNKNQYDVPAKNKQSKDKKK